MGECIRHEHDFSHAPCRWPENSEFAHDLHGEQ